MNLDRLKECSESVSHAEDVILRAKRQLELVRAQAFAPQKYSPTVNSPDLTAATVSEIRWDEKSRSPDGMLYAPKLSTCFKHKR